MRRMMLNGKNIMALREIYKREPITDRNTVISFGKYKGESIADILEIDPQYLVWLHNNSSFFELGCELLEEAEEQEERCVDQELKRRVKREIGSWQDWM